MMGNGMIIMQHFALTERRILLQTLFTQPHKSIQTALSNFAHTGCTGGNSGFIILPKKTGIWTNWLINLPNFQLTDSASWAPPNTSVIGAVLTYLWPAFFKDLLVDFEQPCSEIIHSDGAVNRHFVQILSAGFSSQCIHFELN